MNRKELIKHLKYEGYLKTNFVESAFLDIPRENFIPEHDKEFAYSDQPLSIGYGQTISAPHMVATMTELLEPKKDDIVLEIGAGSGYQAAILSKLVKKVYTIELRKELIPIAEGNLKKSDCHNVEVILGDGSKGYNKAAPFDKVLITCAVDEIPKELLKQLKEGGIIVAPVGRFIQTLVVGKKRKGKLENRNYFRCMFVPMRHQ